jgi:hypothetical protein
MLENSQLRESLIHLALEAGATWPEIEGALKAPR